MFSEASENGIRLNGRESRGLSYLRETGCILGAFSRVWEGVVSKRRRRGLRAWYDWRRMLAAVSRGECWKGGKEKDHGRGRHREAQDGRTAEVRLCGWAWSRAIIHLGQPRGHLEALRADDTDRKGTGGPWSGERGRWRGDRRGEAMCQNSTD